MPRRESWRVGGYRERRTRCTASWRRSDRCATEEWSACCSARNACRGCRAGARRRLGTTPAAWSGRRGRHAWRERRGGGVRGVSRGRATVDVFRETFIKKRPRSCFVGKKRNKKGGFLASTKRNQEKNLPRRGRDSSNTSADILLDAFFFFEERNIRPPTGGASNDALSRDGARVARSVETRGVERCGRIARDDRDGWTHRSHVHGAHARRSRIPDSSRVAHRHAGSRDREPTGLRSTARPTKRERGDTVRIGKSRFPGRAGIRRRRLDRASVGGIERARGFTEDQIENRASGIGETTVAGVAHLTSAPHVEGCKRVFRFVGLRPVRFLEPEPSVRKKRETEKVRGERGQTRGRETESTAWGALQ